MQKWNYKIHSYENYSVSKDWRCLTYCDNLEEKINCASCGKIKKYGDMYTSKEIHDNIGFGYAICEKCNEIEWNRRKEYE